MLEIKKECTGCMACRNVCPVQAIGQTENKYGFTMPLIRAEECVNCGLCEKVCPLESPQIKNRDNGEEALQKNSQDRPIASAPIKAYAMYHRSEKVVRRSSSGGAFYALARETMREGGVVFGCYYDIRRKKAYLTNTDEIPLAKLLTSKYVESEIGDGFQKVKAFLDTGRKVLFCGTPCQAAGLSCFLRRDYENLLLVDFTCGAVSAQSYLREYLEKLEKRYGAPLKSFSFRDKHYGWGQYCLFAQFENRKIYRKTAMSDPYFFCFLRSSMQRLSCHGCQFSDRHFSDIVLSDFWKCDQFEVDGNERKGISLVLAMTPKGQGALKKIEKQMHTEELPVEAASYNLRGRTHICPEEKLPEIYRDQKCAAREGVTALRKRLLSPKQRAFFALRQFVMDHPSLAVHFPELVGNGQIMKK